MKTSASPDQKTEPENYSLDFDIPARKPMAAKVVVSEQIHLSMPAQCVCCGGQADKQIATHASQSTTYLFHSTSRTIKVEFPICQPCQKHSGAQRYQRLLQVLSSAFASTAIVYIFTKSHHIDPLLYIGEGLLIAIAFFFAIAYLWPFRPLGSHHATRGPAVSISSWIGGTIEFVFWNTDYAAQFASNHGGVYKEWAPRFHDLHDHVYRGWAALACLVWLIIITFFGICSLALIPTS